MICLEDFFVGLGDVCGMDREICFSESGNISNILATFGKMHYFLAPKNYKGSSSKQRHFSEQVASTFILINS